MRAISADGTERHQRRSGVVMASWCLLLVAVLAALLVTRRTPAPAPERAASGLGVDPVALVPPGPRLLLSVDVASLSRLDGDELRRLQGDKLLGLRETCGFEPLLSVERAVLAMPAAAGGHESSDFALIAATRIEQERGLVCAERVIAQRGGNPARAKLGAFTSVRDLRRPIGEVALRRDGVFVLSGGSYFRAVVDTTVGAADEAAKLRTRLHRSLRVELGEAQLVLTLLPEPSSPLSEVVALGLALQIGANLRLRGLAACASADACLRARRVVEGVRDELGREAALSGLANLAIEQAGDRLTLAGTLPREQLVPLLSQLLAP